MQVRSNVEGRNLLWSYPLTGLADAGVPIHLPSLVVPCKTSVTRDVDVKLQGLRESDLTHISNLSITSFTLEVVTLEEEHKLTIARALRVQPVGLTRLHDDVSSDFVAKYRILFEPLKVFSTQVNITITCKNVGRWKADIDIDSTQPEPDDVIKLRAAVGSSDSVSFRLNNRFLSFSPFKCYFAPRSSTKFHVSPSAGVLPPYGSEGSAFVVTFSPTEYGNFQRAHLIIATEDAQWDYEIVGEFPEYNIEKMDIRSKTNSHR